MFQKVTSKNLHLLKLGAVIIKYPTIGHPEDVIDIGDDSLSWLYEFTKTVGGELYLTSDPANLHFMSGLAFDDETITSQEMIEDGRYWIYVEAQ